jgi:predicted outer membrane repeat protein
LYAILSSKVWIKDSYFLDGLSKLGGAMYIEGNSSIDMVRTVFQNNFARRKGGAIFANGFNLLRTTGQSKFLNNLANEDGDDIYISNTEGYFVLDNTQIENPKAVSSIAAENVNVSLSNVFMKNIGVQPHRALTEGSGLSCYNCRAILIDKCQFTNLNS